MNRSNLTKRNTGTKGNLSRIEGVLKHSECFCHKMGNQAEMHTGCPFSNNSVDLVVKSLPMGQGGRYT